MSKKYNKAVFIGRMQPIHKGHLINIKKCFELADEVIIIAGSGNSPITIKNPFSDGDRYRMIEDAIRSEFGNEFVGRYSVSLVKDHLYSDNDWIIEVQQVVSQHQGESVVLVGHDKDGTASHLEMFPQWDFYDTEEIVRHNGETYHSSDFREELFDNEGFPESWKDCLLPVTIDFIKPWTTGKGFKSLIEEYKYLKEYPTIWGKGPFVTTDSVVITNGHVLMIKRGCNPGKGNYALPGGFLDPDETILDGAIRELKEETKIKVPPAILKLNVRGSKVFDHPKRSLRGRIITNAFLIELQGNTGLPKIKAGDDAAECYWIPLNKLDSMISEIHEDHYSIIKYFV